MAGVAVTAWEVIPGNREFVVKTGSMSVAVRNGMITGIEDLARNHVWSRQELEDSDLPAGLGILSDVENFRKSHIPWGEPILGQHLKLDFKLVNYYRPTEKSQYELRREKEGTAVATWIGLDNGQEFLPQAKLVLTLWKEQGGTLAYQISGSNPQGGVFSASVPVINLRKTAQVIAPSFGGIRHTSDGVPALMPLGGAPFMEAPILIAEEERHSLAIWMEDAVKPFYAYILRSGKSFGITFEQLNLMPFEPKNEITTATVHLNVFAGDWKTAAAPLRNWYQEHFKNEIAIRDQVEWMRNIRAVFDIYMTVPNDRELAKIATLFPPGSILFQVWNARAANFDTELPDWTPRAGYVDGVKRLHRHGFKVMAYVNTYCANYQSEIWERDRLSEFFLTRKNSMWYYKGKSMGNQQDSLNEKLIGTVDYSEGANQFRDIPKGRLLYVDPLSARWRQYHADMMKWWNTTTGTDANYEDTAGCVGDFGNGVIDGLSAGQGSVAQMRLLQRSQPDIPMSSEYGPAGIAFATSLALNYAGHWGSDEFKRYRINHQYPLMTYLYGYRQWISANMAAKPIHSHAMSAASDATGGLGFSLMDYFLNRTPDVINSNYGWNGHFYWRSRIFADHNLTPYFPVADYPPDIRCQYRGKDGIYSYYDDGVFQQMLCPAGQPLYGRVHGTDRVKTSLWLENWPLQNDGEIFGLDPSRHYPLFPKPKQAEKEPVGLQSVPDKVVLKEYRTGNGYAYLEFAALDDGPKEIILSLTHDGRFSKFFANDEEVKPDRIHGALPLRIVCLTGHEAEPDLSKRQVKSFRGRRLYLNNSGNLDFVYRIANSTQALEFCFRNQQEKYPFHGFDGSIVRLLINGREIHSYDCLPEPGKAAPDTQMRRWIVPVGAYAGKSILVSVVTDFKAQAIQDCQFVGVPNRIRAEGQKFMEEIMSDEFTVKNIIAEPEKWEGGTLEPMDNGKMLKGTGVRFAAGIFKIDPAKIYRLCGQFKAGKASETGNTLLGLAPFDEQTRQITPIQVNPVAATETELSEDFAAGASEIAIKDPSNWKPGNFTGVAFEIKPDKTDLPNRNITMIAELKENRVTLNKPLDKDYPAGTKVRQHLSGNSYIYVGGPKVPADKWLDVGGEISGESLMGLGNSQWWRGTRQVRIVLITTQPDVIFRNIRLEEIN